MKKTTAKFMSILLALAFVMMVLQPANQVLAMPVTGDVVLAPSSVSDQASMKTLEEFAASLNNGKSSQIVGLYAKDIFALKVVQQPSGNAGYVSTSSSSVATQFGMASSYGSIGMLAHNYLAGGKFSSLGSGTVIYVIYGDGKTVAYKVSQVKKFQAVSPNSATSNFIDLSNSKTLTSTEVFKKTYGNSGALILQTCISKDGNSSWGRLFVIAYKSK
jgi:hypothetical protein